MAKIYGHRWVSSYGEEDDGTWLSALAQLTPAHLAYGLQQCLEAGEEWPPSLPAFRNMCLDINPDTVEREVARIVGAWDWNRMTRDQQAAAVRRHSSQATTRLTQERIECDAPLLPRMP